MPEARTFRVKILHGGRHGGYDDVFLGANGGADDGVTDRGCVCSTLLDKPSHNGAIW